MSETAFLTKYDDDHQLDNHKEFNVHSLTWSQTEDIYRDRLVSPVFIDSLNSLSEHPNKYDVDKEISAGMLTWIDDNKELFGETTSTRLALIAQSTMQVHHSRLINQYQQKRRSGQNLSSDERERLKWCKLQAVEYNQLLSGYMYDNCDDSYGELAVGLMGPTFDAFSGLDEKREVEQTLRNTLRGARYESITRQALDKIGIDYRLPTPEEDMRGSDIFIMGYGVDIKCSLDQVVSAQNGYEGSIEECCRVEPSRNPGQKPHILFWPGISEPSLKDSLAWDGDVNMVIPFFVQLNNAIKSVS